MGLRGPLPKNRRSTTPPAAPCEPLRPPEWLPDAARMVWQEIEPRCRAAGQLRPGHEEVMAAYACTAAELRVLSATLAASGSTYQGPHGRCPSAEHSAAVRLRSTLVSIAKCLGLTHDAQARLEAGRPLADDPADEVAAYARSRDQPRANGEAAPLPPTREGHQPSVLDFIRNRDAG